ncbi:hypothetical protein C9374_008456 [Naegleria lovaniensis]|uniref:Uncharacterized protein n=1 Tax=Naegleria lovaniensis TaxID=51637 RepID=A0AA88KHY7_NAELO|nr:uncharacterized protein C9374_008456 [Naegleria lovaniensis]KAG2378313.1 hypothetical protein C9374_008456 [Naegleria lovaniensis]
MIKSSNSLINSLSKARSLLHAHHRQPFPSLNQKQNSMMVMIIGNRVTDFSNNPCNNTKRNVSFISPGMLEEYGEEDRTPLDARELIARIKKNHQLEDHAGITLFKDPLNHLIYGTTSHRKKFQHRWNSSSSRMKRRTAQSSCY